MLHVSSRSLSYFLETSWPLEEGASGDHLGNPLQWFARLLVRLGLVLTVQVQNQGIRPLCTHTYTAVDLKQAVAFGPFLTSRWTF